MEGPSDCLAKIEAFEKERQEAEESKFKVKQTVQRKDLTPDDETVHQPTTHNMTGILSLERLHPKIFIRDSD